MNFFCAFAKWSKYLVFYFFALKDWCSFDQNNDMFLLIVLIEPVVKISALVSMQQEKYLR